MVVYGHTPTPEPEWINNTICLDTGCVFGGSLTALRYPERELVAVQAAEQYYEPAKPLHVPSAPAREPDVLDITDVTGRRVIETAYARAAQHSRRAGRCALEVMSRFAIDPRFLLYLPPTMSPVATSPVPGLLEHPDAGVRAYPGEGVDRVGVRGEAHGLARGRAADPRRRRRGEAVRPGRAWAVHTRTGRSFFGPR